MQLQAYACMVDTGAGNILKYCQHFLSPAPYILAIDTCSASLAIGLKVHVHTFVCVLPAVCCVGTRHNSCGRSEQHWRQLASRWCVWCTSG